MLDSIAERCPSAALSLGFDVQKIEREKARQHERNCNAMAYVAGALKRDSNGRLRRNGRFVSVVR